MLDRTIVFLMRFYARLPPDERINLYFSFLNVICILIKYSQINLKIENFETLMENLKNGKERTQSVNARRN